MTRAQPMHREMLALQLEQLQLIDMQIAKLSRMIAQAMKPHQEAVMRAPILGGLSSSLLVLGERFGPRPRCGIMRT